MKKLIFILIFCSAFSLFAQKKNALLIANANYKYFGALNTPVDEARQLKAALTQIGFSVTLLENADRIAMQDAIDDFGEKLKDSGGTGFFHYGGHAVQVNGMNYLIPIDANIPDQQKVASRTIALDDLMLSMNADQNIVILDACRDNPLPSETRSAGTRGLALVNVKPKNSIIVYSADSGYTAQDGVFTPSLIKHIKEKKEFTQILRDVRKEVQDVTKGKQNPGSYDQLNSDIYLAGVPSTTTTTTVVTKTADTKSAEEYYQMAIKYYKNADYEDAAKYFELGANGGNMQAQYNLGVLYEKGRGVKQSNVSAAYWYEKSANLGYAKAQYNIACYYINGTGVKRDTEKAKYYFKKAAAQGDTTSKQALKKYFNITY